MFRVESWSCVLGDEMQFMIWVSSPQVLFSLKTNTRNAKKSGHMQYTATYISFFCDDISAVVIEFVVGSITILQKKSIHNTKQNNVRVSIFFFLINNTAAGGRGRVRRGGFEAAELRGEHTLWREEMCCPPLRSPQLHSSKESGKIFSGQTRRSSV